MRCGIPWAFVNRIFSPFRLPLLNNENVAHYILLMFDLDEKKLHVYDSLHNEVFENTLEHVTKFARVNPRMMKALQLENLHHYFGSIDYNDLEVVWQETPEQTNLVSCGEFMLSNVEPLIHGKNICDFEPAKFNAYQE